jgi:hypothetical protein
MGIPVAVEHIRPMRGGAQSQLMRADDGHYYVVKFVNNPQGRRILANEFLGARFAQALGLPIPTSEIINVPLALIELSPGMVIRSGGALTNCAPGLQFGSRLPVQDPNAPIFDYLPTPALDLVDNLQDFIGMLVFDKWTCNCNGRQVVFCRQARNRKLRVFMVDQGFCFNAEEWNFPDSPLRGVYAWNYVYGSANSSVTGWESFERWLQRLESLEEESILAAGDDIPPEWYGNDRDALERLLKELVKRRQSVRRLIAEVRDSPRHPFEHWKSA